MKELISVIVPIYGVEKYLPSCIESLINQTYDNLEIILVDDGSKDSCPNICDQYAKKDSRIKVIHKQNGGLSSARNAALKVATGRYLAFVDGDDTINLECFEIVHDLIETNSADIAFYGAVKVYEDENGKIEVPNVNISKENGKLISNSEAIKLMLTDETVGNFVCTKLFRKELFDNIFFPEGKVYEDVATTYKVVSKASKIVYTNLQLYNYLFGRIGAITSSFSEKKILDSLDAYSTQYKFLKDNYSNIKDDITVSWIKMYTSAMEKLCLNDYDELWNSNEVLSRYEEFKIAIDSIDKKILNNTLEPYRVISSVLLRYDRDTYKKMAKIIANTVKIYKD